MRILKKSSSRRKCFDLFSLILFLISNNVLLVYQRMYVDHGGETFILYVDI